MQRKAEIEEGARFAEDRQMAGYNADGQQMSKNAKKKMCGKVFDYETADRDAPWKKFMAVQIVWLELR